MGLDNAGYQGSMGAARSAEIELRGAGAVLLELPVPKTAEPHLHAPAALRPVGPRPINLRPPPGQASPSRAVLARAAPRRRHHARALDGLLSLGWSDPRP